jgi:hypothetical protein
VTQHDEMRRRAARGRQAWTGKRACAERHGEVLTRQAPGALVCST